MPHSDVLVLGLDVCGGSARALVSTLSGELVGYGRAGRDSPAFREPLVAEVEAALKGALSDIDPSVVRAGVLGLSGGADPPVADRFDKVWHEAGLRCPVRIVCDVLVAYAAGTTAPAGTVLVAGTGAIAARIAHGRVVRTADGLGWLLGDEGSGFWQGREAVRRVARTLYASRRAGPLARLLAAELHSGPDPEALVAAAYRRAPLELARLAPLVARTASADPVARGIVEDAAAALVDTVARVHDPTGDGPIVLAGGLLATDGPVRRAVRRRLRTRWRSPIRTAGCGVAGAAWLAARALGGEHLDDLHGRLREAVSPADQIL